MKRIFYSSGSVVTGDRTADALVHYADALAGRDSSDTVDIVVALDSGASGRAQLLIGPASQLVVVPEEDPAAEVEDEDTVRELVRRTALLSSPRPQASDETTTSDYGEFSDYTDAPGEG